MRPFILASVLLISACAAESYPSYVGPIDPIFAPQVADDMAGFVRTQIKAKDGSVQIEQPAGDLIVGPLLSADLKESGYTIVTNGGKHRIRYAAATLDSTDVMARVSVDRADAARLYRDRPVVGLSPLGPFTLTEIGE
jgi:hypothetical protein